MKITIESKSHSKANSESRKAIATEINRIALYLEGKLSPYYQAPFDKLELIGIIRKYSNVGYSNDFFKVIDSRDFYLMTLSRIERADPDSLEKIIEELKIPEGVYYSH